MEQDQLDAGTKDLVNKVLERQAKGSKHCRITRPPVQANSTIAESPSRHGRLPAPDTYNRSLRSFTLCLAFC